MPPPVSLRHDEGPPLAAAMHAWGNADLDSCWYAGICFIYNAFRGYPAHGIDHRAGSGEHVAERAGERYTELPRIRLSGPPGGWPELPGSYPKVSQEWLSRGISTRSDSIPAASTRDLRDTILELTIRGRDAASFGRNS